ncbi:MAG: helix-turn-helix domain-containing protein [Phycisphaerales bacterium]|nr:helix-turn-helix domain-containing protein [Phycisphaerales bacterium]
MRTRGEPRASTTLAYVERVNLVIDHVVSHLRDPLSLVSLARIAHLSPYHFHRVFQALVGETPAEFVKRLRLERALLMMAHAPRRPLTRVALECGFASSSDFSRSFKRQYGAAPSRFDLKGWRAAHLGELEAVTSRPGESRHVARLPARENPDGFRVRIRDVPARRVAYIRVAEPYKADAVPAAARRLVAWAEIRGLADGQWLGYQWESPELVPLEQCRYHVAVEAARFEPEGEVGRFSFPPMVVAQVEVRGGIDLELSALRWLYGVWLPRSGYVPDDHPCFEAWIGRPFAHGAEHFELFVQLPVRRR